MTLTTFFGFFPLCLWMKTPLYTNKMQTSQPPVQLLTCIEGRRCKWNSYEKNYLWYIGGKRVDWVWGFSAQSIEGKEKSTLNKSSSPLWPRLTFTCYSSSSQCYIPAPWHLWFSLALITTQKLVGVTHSLQMGKLSLGEQDRWLVWGLWASK